MGPDGSVGGALVSAIVNKTARSSRRHWTVPARSKGEWIMRHFRISSQATALVAVGLLAAMTLLAESGGVSPQDVFSRFQEAIAKGDLATVIDCVPPLDRAEGAMGLLLGAVFATMDAKDPEAMQQDFDAALGKHWPSFLEPSEPSGEPRTPEEATMALRAEFAEVDVVALFSALSEVMAKHIGPQWPESFEVFSDELTDVKIDGDQATGKVSEEEVEFRRLEGRWYLVMN